MRIALAQMKISSDVEVNYRKPISLIRVATTDQHGIRRFNGYITPDTAHCYSGICCSKCKRIINAVPIIHIGSSLPACGGYLIFFRRTGGCYEVCLHHIEQHGDRWISSGDYKNTADGDYCGLCQPLFYFLLFQSLLIFQSPFFHRFDDRAHGFAEF